MYNPGIESAMVDRGSLRKMAFAQVYGSSYYSQSSKERIPYKSISQRSHSSRCYTGAQDSGPNCAPCASIPVPHGSSPSHESMGTCPNFWHSENNMMPPNACWFEKDSNWSNGDHTVWRSFGPAYHVNVNQGIMKSTFAYFYI